MFGCRPLVSPDPTPLMRRLLAGSALGLALSAPGIAVAQNTPVQLPPVSVEGAAPEVRQEYNTAAPSMPKLTEPLRDTPQTITAVPRQLMQDQGVSTLRDALRNVTGVSLNAGEGGRQGDSVTIRGFSASNDMYLDGTLDFGSYYRDPFNLEQVEVLTGPSSVLFGKGSTGGVVNQVSKTPFAGRYMGGSVGLGTNLTKRVTLDMNEPIGTGAAFRINVMAHNNEFADRDAAENSRFGIAPSLSFGLGSDTRTTLSYLHQSEYDVPDYGLPWLDQRGDSYAFPAPTRRANFYGFKSDDYLRTNADVLTGKIEHDFSDQRFTLRNQLRVANYSREFRITEPQISGTAASTANVQNLAVTRNMLAGRSVETHVENQTDLISRFETSSLEHTLVTGVAFGRQTSDPTRYSFTGVPGTTVGSPNYNDTFSFTTQSISQMSGTLAYTQAAYALDTVKLNDQWQVMGGLRFDRFDANYHNQIAQNTSTNNTPAGTITRVDEMPSYRAAIVYKPAPNGSIYAQYGTSFNPSAESVSLNAATGSLAPEKNETYEAGSKWDLFGERLSLTGAIFQIEKTNARESDPTNAFRNVLTGNVTVQGISLGGSGRITKDWAVFTGYTYLEGSVESAIANNNGRRPSNLPRNTFSLWSTYDLTDRWQIGGGATHVGQRFASATTDANGFRRTAPSYWTAQSMAKYKLTDSVDLQLNIYNIFDKTYFDQLHPSHVVPGEGRTALLTTSFKF